jgi:hypothetical protein
MGKQASGPRQRDGRSGRAPGARQPAIGSGLASASREEQRRCHHCSLPCNAAAAPRLSLLVHGGSEPQVAPRAGDCRFRPRGAVWPCAAAGRPDAGVCGSAELTLASRREGLSVDGTCDADGEPVDRWLARRPPRTRDAVARLPVRGKIRGQLGCPRADVLRSPQAFTDGFVAEIGAAAGLRARRRGRRVGAAARIGEQEPAVALAGSYRVTPVGPHFHPG